MHLRHTCLHFARHVRDDSEQTLHQHQLGAMMHLVFFQPEDHFEARLAGRGHPGRKGNGLGKEIVREAVHPFRQAIAVGLQQR